MEKERRERFWIQSACDNVGSLVGAGGSPAAYSKKRDWMSEEDKANAEEIVNGVKAQVAKDAELANKLLARGHPHPSVSIGTLTPLQRDVLAGLLDGFSVNKIAELYGHNVHSVKAAKRSLHKKGLIVVSCTPPEGTMTTIKSSPQVHNFLVDIIVPSPTTRWRERLNIEQVKNYQVRRLRYNTQEFFDLSEQVSVRVTTKKILLTVKDVWGDSPADCRARAWALAVDACSQLKALYAFREDLQMRFKGAEYALVNHEVAEKCKNAGIKPVTIVQGAKRMFVDDTPKKSLEFTRLSDAERSYNDEEARVLRGLTNENLARHLLDVSQKLGMVCDSLAVLAKVQSSQIEVLNKVFGVNRQEESKPRVLERVSYIG